MQELVDYAGKRGDVNKVRVPTSETAAKVQGYKPVITSEEIIQKYNKLKGTREWDEIVLDTPDADKVRFEKVLKGEIKGDIYELDKETILKKYKEQPKTIKKLFGVEPKIVTDSKGNSWYEFDIPDKAKKGKMEIKAFTTTGAVIGVGALQETPQYQKGGQHGGLDRWFAEKWVDVKTGKECGRQEGEKRAGYPACRPSKRISEDTPKTASELSSAEKEKFKRSKTSSERISYQHKRKQEGGEWLDKYENTKKNRQKVDQLFGPPAAGNVDYVPAVESVVGGFSAGLAKSALAPVVKSNLQSLQKYMEMQDSPFAKIDLPVFNEAKNWLNKYDDQVTTK